MTKENDTTKKEYFKPLSYIRVVWILLVAFLLLDFGYYMVTSKGVTLDARTIFDAINPSRADKPPQLSKKTIAELDKIVSDYDLIVGLQVTQANFQRNTRHIIYTSIDDDDLKKIYDIFVKSIIGDLPLFNGDSSNDDRLSKIMNGELVCLPFAETLPAKLAPAATKRVNTICASSIPPGYGRMTGILTIYLKSKPTDIEIDQLRVLSRNVSILLNKEISSGIK